MAEPFIAEIRYFSFNYAPTGWAQCNGQILQIQQNQALYSLVGKNFGGDGIKTFGLPNLQGQAVVGPSATSTPPLPLYSKGGEETHTLLLTEMPAHTHTAAGTSADAQLRSPQDNAWATTATAAFTNTGTPNCTMNATAIANTGGGQGHPNMQPYLVLNFCIALSGNYPARN